ncbi:MAG: carboxypeptidase-like regulatory domain-containing protein [Polyangia bacterium]|uniref:Carboxypeptidase regulatory-like domain-containing protein n=1 Tax=uncultured bacterium A1Q1_fos_1070 TaxID=1256541 RepID=L7VWM4_9BACT|nr:conserved hypothetical protein SCD8A.23 [uncultured bacterium A1Q1_fos_1070]
MSVHDAERAQFYARLSLLLGCALTGVVLGGLASRLPRRAREVVPPRVVPLPQPAQVVIPDLAVLPVIALPDAGTSKPRELWVLLVDQSGLPVEGVSVLARPGMLTASATTQGLGELGVLPGPLPFPEDVIAGQSALAGSLQRGSAGASSWLARSDASGLVHFVGVASGRLLLLANHQGKSASGEVEVPVEASSSSSARMVMRLASPVECAEPSASESSDPLQPGSGLAARADLRGRVVDHRGFAVATARVDVQVGGARSQALSDVRGQFVLPMLTAGEARLSVRAPGFAPAFLSVKMEQRRDELKVELRPGGGISGLIEDVRTSGLPDGLEVWLDLPSGERLSVPIGPDGRFVQTGLPTGLLTLRARARGYASLRQVVHVTESSSPDQVTVRDVRLRFVRGAELAGQVRGPSGSVEGVEVVATGEDGQVLARTRTDRRGEFVLSDLVPGRLRLQVTGAQGAGTATVELRSGDRARQDVELSGR